MGNVTGTGESVRWWSHAVGMPPILTVGFAGNVLNLLILARGPKSGLVGVTFTYLLGVAVADLAAILALVPFVVQENAHPFAHAYAWVFYQAHICVPVINSFMSANSLCIVALTVERYISICHPIVGHRLKVGARKRAVQVMCVAWVAAFAFYLPQLLQKRVVGDAGHGYRIERVYTVPPAYLVPRELCCRFIPILLLAVLNARIMSGFRLRAKNHRALLSSRTASAASNLKDQRNGSITSDKLNTVTKEDRWEAEWSVYLLLIVTVVAFCLCNLPASLLSLTVSLARPAEEHFEFQLFRAVANLAEVAGHASNFYLYCLCSTDYRRAFAKLLGCWPKETPAQNGHGNPANGTGATLLSRLNGRIATSASGEGLLPRTRTASSQPDSLPTSPISPHEEEVQRFSHAYSQQTSPVSPSEDLRRFTLSTEPAAAV